MGSRDWPPEKVPSVEDEEFSAACISSPGPAGYPRP